MTTSADRSELWSTIAKLQSYIEQFRSELHVRQTAASSLLQHCEWLVHQSESLYAHPWQQPGKAMVATRASELRRWGVALQQGKIIDRMQARLQVYEEEAQRIQSLAAIRTDATDTTPLLSITDDDDNNNEDVETNVQPHAMSMDDPSSAQMDLDDISATLTTTHSLPAHTNGMDLTTLALSDNDTVDVLNARVQELMHHLRLEAVGLPPPESVVPSSLAVTVKDSQSHRDKAGSGTSAGHAWAFDANNTCKACGSMIRILPSEQKTICVSCGQIQPYNNTVDSARGFVQDAGNSVCETTLVLENRIRRTWLHAQAMSDDDEKDTIDHAIVVAVARRIAQQYFVTLASTHTADATSDPETQNDHQAMAMRPAENDSTNGRSVELLCSEISIRPADVHQAMIALRLQQWLWADVYIWEKITQRKAPKSSVDLSNRMFRTACTMLQCDFLRKHASERKFYNRLRFFVARIACLVGFPELEPFLPICLMPKKREEFETQWQQEVMEYKLYDSS